MKKSHYTYLLYNGKQFYIGVRSCEGKPEDDYDYLSSSSDKDFKNSIVAKTILRTFKTRKEANLHEIQLHDFHDVAVNPKFANRAKAVSTGFCTQGVRLSKETKSKLSAAHRGKNLSAATKAKIAASGKGKKKSADYRSKMSASRKGLNNPAADHTVYIFSHETGETFVGTRLKFAEKYKIRIHSLFSKKHQRFITKGWRVTCKLL